MYIVHKDMQKWIIMKSSLEHIYIISFMKITSFRKQNVPFMTNWIKIIQKGIWMYIIHTDMKMSKLYVVIKTLWKKYMYIH